MNEVDQDVESRVQHEVQRELDLHQQKRLIHEKRSADQVAREAQELIRRQQE